MARAPERGRGEASQPVNEPVRGQGGNLDQSEHRWTLQMLTQLAGDMGGVKESVQGLKQAVDDLKKEDLKELRQSVKWLSRTVWIASGVVLAVGYLLNGGIGTILRSLSGVGATH